jgi:hypothetical protein
VNPGEATTRYSAEASRAGIQVRAVSHLLRAVDSGTIAAAELNEFVSLASVSAAVIRRSMAELRLNPANLVLNGAFYFLRGGRIVAAVQQPALLTWIASRWYRAAVLALLLGLVVAALVRYS